MEVNIKYSYQLMDNFKPASYAEGDKKMQAICNDELNSFFSIGSDSALYLTCQRIGYSTGWQQINISKSISTDNNGAAVSVNDFSAVKNSENKYEIAIIAKVDNKDCLYVSSEENIDKPVWKKIDFDDSTVKNTIEMKNVYLSLTGDKTYLVVDIFEKDTGKSLDIFKRYFIDTYNDISEQNWIENPFPVDFSSIDTTCMGRSRKDPVDDTFTLGSISNTKQIVCTPVYNYFNPSAAPTSKRFVVPDKVDVITTIKELNSNETALFACGGGKLYVFPVNAQADGTKPSCIASSDLMVDVKSLYAVRINEKLLIVGLNENGSIFEVFCENNQIADANSWSTVLILQTGIQYVYPYKNPNFDSLSIFSYAKDSFVKLSEQSLDTGLWNDTIVTLPAKSDKPKQFSSYTTRISLSDSENGMALTNTKVYIKASTPCSLYVNGRYYSLRSNPIDIYTNAQGCINIMHTAHSTNSCNFTIWTDESRKFDIVPSDHVVEKLLALNTPDKLKNASTKDGTKLIPENASDSDIAAIATAIDFLGDTKKTLNITKAHKLLGMSPEKYFESNENHGKLVIKVNNGRIESHTGNNALMIINEMGYESVQVTKTSWSDIKYFAGEILETIKNGINKVFNIVIDFFNNAWNFILEVGGKIYNFVITCIEQVVDIVESVFALIKVAVEKIIEYVKFLFDWDDIVRVKDIVKKSISLTNTYACDQITVLQNQVNKYVDILISKIDEWAEIPEYKNVPVSDLKDAYKLDDEVSQMFLSDKFISYYPLSDTEVKLQAMVREDSSLMDAFKVLIEAAKNEGSILQNMCERMYDNIFRKDNFSSLSLAEILKRTMAILADTTLNTAANVFTAAMDVVKIILNVIDEFLNAPIYIPVFSEILEMVGVKAPSLLDIVCLLPAVATTLICKVTTGKAPVTEEEYNYWMGLDKFESYKKLQLCAMSTNNNQIVVSEMDKTFFDLYHILSGIIALHETFLHPIKTATKSEFTYAYDFFALAEGAVYLSGIFVYDPFSDLLKDKLSEDVNKLITGITHTIVLCKISSEIINIFLDKENQKKAKTTVGVIYIIASICEMIQMAGTIIYDAIEEDNTKKKNLVCVNAASLFADDIKNILDFSQEFMNDPVSLGITEGCRSICSLAYDAMQISVGIMGSSYLEVE